MPPPRHLSTFLSVLPYLWQYPISLCVPFISDCAHGLSVPSVIDRDPPSLSMPSHFSLYPLHLLLYPSWTLISDHDFQFPNVTLSFTVPHISMSPDFSPCPPISHCGSTFLIVPLVSFCAPQICVSLLAPHLWPCPTVTYINRSIIYLLVSFLKTTLEQMLRGEQNSLLSPQAQNVLATALA